MRLSAREIGEAVSGVLAASDRDYALELITVFQAQARVAEETGERLSFEEFADQVGIDLAQPRAAE